MHSTPRFTTFLSTDTLAAHLDDADWAIVDCRFELADATVGDVAYHAAHIPGAVYAHLDRDLSSPLTPRSGRHPLPDFAEFRARAAGWGIDRRVQVVVYDQDVGLYASRLWWLLRTTGHQAVAILDGGFAKWVSEERPTRGGEEQRAARVFEGRPAPARFVGADQVAELARDPSALVIDVRAPERYNGEIEPIDPVAGHIPGARNYFVRLNLSPDGTVLPAAELRSKLEHLLGGVSPDRVVAYCGSGVFSCHLLAALEHAGLPGARLYPGSWSEWCRDHKRPVATGSEP